MKAVENPPFQEMKGCVNPVNKFSATLHFRGTTKKTTNVDLSQEAGNYREFQHLLIVSFYNSLLLISYITINLNMFLI